jgi:photosystem II stability/assembly factor-like uncharacterized protein
MSRYKIMRTPHWILLVATLLLAAIAPASAAWSPVGSPIQPFITLQLDPGRPELLYARVFASEGPGEDYLWRSEDGGATWRNVQRGLENPITALAIDPSNPRVIWVWTPDGQLWRSANAGDTWVRRFVTPANQIPPYVLQLLVDPHHPDTLYRVDARDLLKTAVAVSRDGGVSFTEGAPVSNLLTFDPVYVHPDRDELLAFDPEGLKASTDGGQTWSLRGRYHGAGFRGGRLAPSDPDTLYGLTPDFDHCLARSDDAGTHWQTLTSPAGLPTRRSYCTDVAIDPRDARHVWLAAQVTEAGKFRRLTFESRDGGVTWSRPFSAPTDGLVAAGGETLYTGSFRGQRLYVSQNGGRTWTLTDAGITAGDLRNGLVAQRLPGGGVGRRLLALNTPIGGSPDSIYRSDGGKDWIKAPLETPSALVDAGGSTVLAVDPRGVVRSQNGGDSWQVVASAPPRPGLFRSNVTQPRYVALLTFEENAAYGNIPLWTSDDGGATWRRSSQGLPIACSHVASVDVCPDFTAYAVDPFNPNHRLVASVDAFPPQPRVFVSEDAGASWHQETADLPRVFALAADPHIPGRVLAGTEGGLFVSEDGGQHWLTLGDWPDGAVIHQFARDESSGSWYAATIAHGIYRSLDNGANWTLLAGAPDHDNPAIAVDPRRPTALLATFRGQGVWRWTP